jgi:D-beta-D-heptose 7-phosphate kinase/D-beta-D-heptose 1-phosphate adenosyltransferase
VAGMKSASNIIHELPPVKPLRIVVIGEAVLDRYIWGDVERLSPEAPIPILRATRREERPGNAAFVCANLAAFGAKPVIVSVIGTDTAGSSLVEILGGLGVQASPLVRDSARPTILKERFLGSVQSANRATQQLLRVDNEDLRPLSQATQAELLSRLEVCLEGADAVLVSDINKGLLTPPVLNAVIQGARHRDIPIIIDPRLADDYALYRGATALTPNRYETERASGISLSNRTAWEASARKLVKELDLSACLVTLDRDGMFVAERNGRAAHIETTPREVYDVTGAGDVVLAVFGLFLATGMDALDAARFANLAAGLEVAKQGATVISRKDLVRALRGMDRGSLRKIVSFEELAAELDRHRLADRRVCFTNGCFDLLHTGHVQTLEFARAHADLLVVGVNSDRSVQRLKGEHRPIYPATDRARIIAALEPVDYVVVFDDPHQIVHLVKPDVLVKGGDWREKTVDGSDFVRSYGGSVVFAPLLEERRTSTIAQLLQRG